MSQKTCCKLFVVSMQGTVQNAYIHWAQAKLTAPTFEATSLSDFSTSINFKMSLKVFGKYHSELKEIILKSVYPHVLLELVIWGEEGWGEGGGTMGMRKI